MTSLVGMKNIIVMSGDIGSGKSSVATALKAMTNYEVIGTGAIQRAIAKRRGVTTLELNQISQTDRSIDDEIDNYVIDIGKTQNNLIIDSRLAWHFIPTAFKVFLAVDPVVGAERVFNASRADEHNPSLEVTLANNAKRQAFEDDRFQLLYQVNFRDYANYDLVIDTSFSSPEIIATKINECYQAWLIQVASPQLWVDPIKLLPSRSVLTTMGADYDLVLDSIKHNGFQQTNAVTVFVNTGFIYIVDGHKRTMAARKAGIALLPANIVSPAVLVKSYGTSPEQLLGNVTSQHLQEWQQALDFTYKINPIPV
jgi:cytidylate kinase